MVHEASSLAAEKHMERANDYHMLVVTLVLQASTSPSESKKKSLVSLVT